MERPFWDAATRLGVWGVRIRGLRSDDGTPPTATIVDSPNGLKFPELHNCKDDQFRTASRGVLDVELPDSGLVD